MKFFKIFLLKSDLIKIFGGGKRDRTADLLHAMQALSQLSYTPITPTNLGLEEHWYFVQLKEGAILMTQRLIVND